MAGSEIIFKPLHDFPAVYSRQTHIQNNRLWRVLISQLQTGFAIASEQTFKPVFMGAIKQEFCRFRLAFIDPERKRSSAPVCYCGLAFCQPWARISRISVTTCAYAGSRAKLVN